MKKHFKKILSFLLIATSFNFLQMINKMPSNILTFAESDIVQNQDIENITIGKCLFVHVKDTPFYIRSNIYDEKLHSKSALKQIYKNAKEKISNVLDLDYPDELEIKIQVFNTNEFYDKLDAIFYGKRFFWFDNSKKLIQIKNECLADNQTLPHEMVHSFLWYKLGDFNNLNQNLNEGLATQMQDLNRWKKQSDFLGHENACFDSEIINYPLHQHISFMIGLNLKVKM